jgi:hypothetical protein
VDIPLKVLCHFTFTKYWKGSISQYFILDNTHTHRSASAVARRAAVGLSSLPPSIALLGE